LIVFLILHLGCEGGSSAVVLEDVEMDRSVRAEDAAADVTPSDVSPTDAEQDLNDAVDPLDAAEPQDTDTTAADLPPEVVEDCETLCVDRECGAVGPPELDCDCGTCDDGNPCTEDLCDSEGGCVAEPDDSLACDDEDPCTSDDRCEDGACVGEPEPCNCVTDADCLDLEDGNPCTGTLFCDTAAMPYECAVDPATVIVCPGPEPGPDAECMVGGCVPESGECDIFDANDGAPCDDGDLCTEDTVCGNGSCGGAWIACADGNPCTTDSCDTESGCVFTPDDGNSCDDGDPCTVDACAGGACLSSILSCDDGDPCTDNACDPQTGLCLESPVSCDDGDPCTVDLCDPALGGCDNSPVVCDDGNTCTDDTCDPETGLCVVTTDDTNLCSDDDLCTTTEVCVDGACVVPEIVLLAEDFSAAAPDWILDGAWEIGPAVAVQCGGNPGDPAVDAGASDDEGLAGSAIGGCVGLPGDPTGTWCITSPPVDASAVPGTLELSLWRFLGFSMALGAWVEVSYGPEWIVLWNEIGHDSSPEWTLEAFDVTAYRSDAMRVRACYGTSDFMPANSGGLSIDDLRLVATPLLCDDANPCTDDVCDPGAGCVSTPNDGNVCDDAVLCTEDACLDGVCVSTPVACDDMNTCTDDACDPLTGECVFAPVPDESPCDDGDACTLEDMCLAGSCAQPPIVHLKEGFEGGGDGWTFGGPWEAGAPAPAVCTDLGVDDYLTFDPEVDAFGGSGGIAGTAIGGCVEDLDTDHCLSSPVIDATGSQGPLTLSFLQHVSANVAIRLRVEAYEGGAWHQVSEQTPPTPSSPDWEAVAVDLTSYRSDALEIRFCYHWLETAPVQWPEVAGWSVDEIRVSGPTHPCDDGNACTDDTCDPVLGTCSHGDAEVVHLSEDFSTVPAGWSISSLWEIGPAVPSAGCAPELGQDPESDHTATDDEGLAGIAIGGCVSIDQDVVGCLQAPAVDATTSAGDLTLRYWRHGGEHPYPAAMHIVQRWEKGSIGSAWIPIAVEEEGTNDAAWTLVEHDLTPWRSDDLKIRICAQVSNLVSNDLEPQRGLSIDDFEIVGGSLNCDDGDPCTLESCAPLSGECVHVVSAPVVHLDEGFADNLNGWTLDEEWEIGPAAPSSWCHPDTGQDPANDHTETTDDGVAGVVIGGCADNSPHPPWCITSPAMDATLSAGALNLSYWRRLGTDASNLRKDEVEVWDGSAWQLLWNHGEFVNDPDWVFQSHDLQAYRNDALRVRFCHEVVHQFSSNASGWSLDDVRIEGDAPCD